MCARNCSRPRGTKQTKSSALVELILQWDQTEKRELNTKTENCQLLVKALRERAGMRDKEHGEGVVLAGFRNVSRQALLRSNNGAGT